LRPESASNRKEINASAKELEWSDQDLLVALGAAIELRTS
jgi:hypothetical protein